MQLNPDLCEPIQDSQVDWINKLVTTIETTRSQEIPQAGDILEYTDELGDWYPSGKIVRIEEGTATVCLVGGSYVFASPLSFHTSGGPWTDLSINGFQFKGIRKRRLQLPPTAAPHQRGLTFEAYVSVWAYNEPDPIYGSYTTRDWNKNIFSHCTDARKRESAGGEYIDFLHLIFATAADFIAWKNTYKAVEFVGPNENSSVVFSYREALHIISEDEYLRLDLPIDTRRNNGDIVIVKFAYDDENHIVDTYSYAGEIRPGAFSGTTHRDLLLDRRSTAKEFERARHGSNWYQGENKLILEGMKKRSIGWMYTQRHQTKGDGV